MSDINVTASNWESFLKKWNQELLDRIDPAMLGYYSYSSYLFSEYGFYHTPGLG